jgi:hypothetical protein
MSQLVKTKRQANFKGFKRAFKGLVEQKNVVFNSFVCKLGLFGTRIPLKMAHACQKRPNLHTNSSNKLSEQLIKTQYIFFVYNRYPEKAYRI